MLDVFLYGKRPSYPHMSVKDTEIWNRFIDKFPTAYKTCQYDFHVGDTAPFDTTIDGSGVANQDMLYRLRIDVIGQTDTKVSVIEIKPKAGPSSIGQLQSYTALYERDKFTNKPIDMILVTDQEMQNMDWLCKDANIKLIVV